MPGSNGWLHLYQLLLCKGGLHRSLLKLLLMANVTTKLSSAGSLFEPEMSMKQF